MTVVYQWPPSTKGKKVEGEIKKMKMPNKETFLSGCRLQKKIQTHCLRSKGTKSDSLKPFSSDEISLSDDSIQDLEPKLHFLRAKH